MDSVFLALACYELGIGLVLTASTAVRQAFVVFFAFILCFAVLWPARSSCGAPCHAIFARFSVVRMDQYRRAISWLIFSKAKKIWPTYWPNTARPKSQAVRKLMPKLYGYFKV